MSEGLKTLKDLPIVLREYTEEEAIKLKEVEKEVIAVIRFKNHLRLLAIKWIKESRGKSFYCVICEEFNCDCLSSGCFKIEAEKLENLFKEFFNINEEDLK